MVKSGDLKVSGADQVNKFLNDQQGKFEIGLQPVQQYIGKKKLKVAAAIVDEVKKLQRVHQMTQSDQAMGALLKNDAHAAYHIVRFDKQAFVRKFSQEIGGSAYASPILLQAVHLLCPGVHVASHFSPVYSRIT